MIARACWIAFWIFIGVGTAAIQIDRQSRYEPGLAEFVPKPARAFSQRHILVDALRDNDRAKAVEHARTLVARRPMPAEHLRLLSLAQLQAGQLEESSYSIQLAARRGWRDRPSQSTMLELALAARDQPEAARRFAALFVRGGGERTEMQELAERVFGPESDEARQVFAQIVAGADRWHRVFLGRAPLIFPPEALVDITERASASGARFDCQRLREASRRVERREQGRGGALLAAGRGC
ncbi:MAG: hypothetical protein QNI87_12745 [Erythrobacter sp.]|uniref:hypothetical protein n=1 Tax=Erythrobacter sp. TaxID=1042 RepID=UPI00261594E0|nr:hypothetical protein [Erythrobacter sp.]MDJ0979387.1 hypothetical protein [Erythrobacter sp.]